MQNLPERGPSGVTDLELAALDLRYEGYRLRQPRREAALLAAIAQAGIQEPLVGVIRDTTPILLDGFQRARCARTLHLHVVPFCVVGHRRGRRHPPTPARRPPTRPELVGTSALRR
ncbi:MAG: hypothetical protein M5U12_11985 [Verrucomicrobia bacterium]|nr:hypothetical protein [Verrucomicrobiota bacterium]